MTEERRGPEKPRKAGDRRRLDIEQTVEAASFMKAGAGKVPRVNGDAWSDLLPAIARHLLGDPPAIEAGDRQATYEAGDDMTKLKDLKKRLMEEPEFREEYARADDEFALIEALVRARTAAKLTQAELARRIGTTQSAIARLEGGGVSPSFATLRRYAEATGTRLTVGFVQADN